MKASIIIVFIFGLLAAGCSTTTYLNLKDTYPQNIGMPLNKTEKDNNIGAGVSMLLKDGTEIQGQLLSVRDSTIKICTEYSATEEELTNLIYPIITITNNELHELTIEGSSYVWIGIGAGALAGGIIGALIVKSEDEVDSREEGLAVMVVFSGGLLGSIAGGIIGYALSTEEYVFQEIPPDYNWSVLKPLSRYPDEEPEYLRAIE